MKSKYRHLIWLLPAAICVAIFIFSSHPADMSDEDANFIMRILGSFFDWASGMLGSVFHAEIDSVLLLRKTAHITEFTALFVSLVIAFRVSVGLRLRRLWPILSLAGTFIYAVSDEFHQTFIEGRAGLFTDVLIDCSLSALITLIYYLCLCFRKK